MLSNRDMRSMPQADLPTDSRSCAGRFLDVSECAGIRVDLGEQEDYLRLVSYCVRKKIKTKILNHNLHGLYHYFTNEELREIYRRSVVMVDGSGVLAILRAHRHKVKFMNRMAWIDFVWPLLAFSERNGLRIFWLGNSPEVSEHGLKTIRERLPRLRISGHHGHFDHRFGSADNQRIVRQINAFRTDICIVGMGTPTQELWMERNHPAVCAPVMFMVGACLEFISGHAIIPPRWLGPLGLEWLYRLATNPGRFAFRYLVEPWRVAYEIAKHDLRGTIRTLSYNGVCQQRALEEGAAERKSK
jgi:N-acetylglucosaminyldiphosphoundecaprenol N-acetyl-beta-D-mannosaminyltransferase